MGRKMLSKLARSTCKFIRRSGLLISNQGDLLCIFNKNGRCTLNLPYFRGPEYNTDLMIEDPFYKFKGVQKGPITVEVSEDALIYHCSNKEQVATFMLRLGFFDSDSFTHFNTTLTRDKALDRFFEFFKIPEC